MGLPVTRIIASRRPSLSASAPSPSEIRIVLDGLMPSFSNRTKAVTSALELLKPTRLPFNSISEDTDVTRVQMDLFIEQFGNVMDALFEPFIERFTLEIVDHIRV